jgi:flavodoxin
MKTLVVYDGNTEKLAWAIAGALGGAAHNVRVEKVEEVAEPDVIGLDLLIVGSPTQTFNTTAAISGFLESLPPNSLSYMNAAAFDTRQRSQRGSNAADKIERLLRQKGGVIAVDAGGFYIEGKGGPLAEGEVERAAEWAAELLKK